ncbi:MAG: DUF1499 domain-containing protein [Nitrospirota bacterium]
MSERKTSWFARWGFVMVVAGAAAAVLAGWGTRADLWSFRVGFLLLQGAVIGAAAGGLLGLIGVWRTRGGKKRGRWRAVLGVLLAVVVAGIPAMYMRKASTLPAIHDITTDPENPPAFSAVAPLRRGAPNPVEYGGPAVAEQQRRAYADIQPLRLETPPARACDRALEAAREMGWEIVDANPAQGRIEATATTFWFGFKDDVVVLVSPTETGSRIDVRSLSRVGRSDVGTNAARIRAYLTKLS